MTLRRISLALALLSGSGAGDLDDPVDDRLHAPMPELPAGLSSSAPHRPAEVAIEDVQLEPDGSIASVIVEGAEHELRIGWSLLRLVLTDLEEEAASGEPLRFVLRSHPSRPAAPAGAPLTLGALAGIALVTEGGATVGTVQGAEICLTSGRVLALALDAGAYRGAPHDLVAVPWSWISVPASPEKARPLRLRVDPAWIDGASAGGWS